jgi:HSP20 family protein
MRRNEQSMPVRRRGGTDLSQWDPGGMLSPATFFSTSPWQMMRRIQEDLDGLFGQFLGGQGGSRDMPATAGQQSSVLQWSPSVDISQTDREWTIEAELPGVRPEDVDIRVQDGYLILRAERIEEEEQPQGGQAGRGDGGQAQGQQGQQARQRQFVRRELRYGFFERVLPLPDNVDEEHITCEFQNGVLRIHLPKTEQPSQQTRRIPIQAGASQGQAGQTERERGTGQAGTREPAMAGAKGGEAGSQETTGRKQS